MTTSDSMQMRKPPVKRTLSRLALPVVAALLLPGCARYVESSELDSAGSSIGVILTLEDGETARGRVLSLDGDEITIEFKYRLGGGTDLRGLGDRRRVVVNGRDVPGEITAVDREGATTVVYLERRLRFRDIEEMTFHRSGREASLGPVVSAMLGPMIGALLALAI